MRKRTEGKEGRPDWGRMCLGAGVSFGVMLALTGAGAGLVNSGTAGEGWMDYLAAGVLLLSAFAGGLASGRGGLSAMAGSAAGFWLALLGLGITLARGFPEGAWATALPVLAGYATAWLLSGNRSRKPARRRRRRRR